MADEKDDCKLGHRDLLRVTGETKDGGFTYIRHRADHEAEVGVLKIPKEGQSMQSTPVTLTRVEDDLFEVEEIGTSTSSESKGPAKVTTDDYRMGWDRIFGGPKTVGQA